GDGRLGHPSPTVSLPPAEDPRRERRDDLASEWHTRPQLAEPCRRERRENAARGNVLERGGRVGGPGDQRGDRVGRLSERERPVPGHDTAGLSGGEPGGLSGGQLAAVAVVGRGLGGGGPAVGGIRVAHGVLTFVFGVILGGIAVGFSVLASCRNSSILERRDRDQ